MAEHSDPIDHANDTAQFFTDEAVEAVRRRSAPEQDPNNLDPCCCDCGEDIEPGRLAMYKKRCITCQTRFEMKEKMNGR